MGTFLSNELLYAALLCFTQVYLTWNTLALHQLIVVSNWYRIIICITLIHDYSTLLHLWTSTHVQGFLKKVEQLELNLDVHTFNSDIRAYTFANGTSKNRGMYVDIHRGLSQSLCSGKSNTLLMNVLRMCYCTFRTCIVLTKKTVTPIHSLTCICVYIIHSGC
jgi:hypothetical protein